MNQIVLQQKLKALASFPNINADTVKRFGEALKELNDWELLRINPLRFAEDHTFDQAETIALFIHGAKVGLFDFAWNMICPCCGALVGSHTSVNEVRGEEYHCALCHIDVPSNLDDQAEVAFTINPGIKKLDISPYRDFASYWRYFMSPNFQRSQTLTDYVDEVKRSSAMIAPDEYQHISLSAEPGCLYRLMSVENHIACFLHVADEKRSDPQVVDIDILPVGFLPDQMKINAGSVTLKVRNLLKAHTGVVLVLTDFQRLHRILKEHPSRMRPFFTGKMLLNNQSFRELFRIQTLIPDLKLRLRSLTILFTDLKGSTELYDKTGDAFAYNLVQEHYRLLTEAVRQHSGAVIKTMGDAIMATFSDPSSGARASIDMMSKIAQLNNKLEKEGCRIGLKIGLHEGPALAVNADDRLDYFGQTVNIAARVQGLAQAGEIWLTDQVFEAAGVRDAFAAGGYREEKQSVSLKGVGQPTMVHRCQGAVSKSR